MNQAPYFETELPSININVKEQDILEGKALVQSFESPTAFDKEGDKIVFKISENPLNEIVSFKKNQQSFTTFIDTSLVRS